MWILNSWWDAFFPQNPPSLTLCGDYEIESSRFAPSLVAMMRPIWWPWCALLGGHDAPPFGGHDAPSLVAMMLPSCCLLIHSVSDCIIIGLEFSFDSYVSIICLMQKVLFFNHILEHSAWVIVRHGAPGGRPLLHIPHRTGIVDKNVRRHYI